MKHKFLSVIIFIALFAINAEAQNQPYQPPVPAAALPATAGVSATGAANYNIPIDVPVGTNGVQPNIAIAYNSQGGFGALGIGWDISGVSVISRGTKSFYYDGDYVEHNSIQFTDEDALYLDGQRLILLIGTHFQEGAIYGTEVENYARVALKTYQHNSKTITYFELKTADGQIIEYGKGNNSRLTGTGGTLAWKISKATDVNENSINYHYTFQGRYLKKITYANEANRIDFIYFENNINSQKRYIKDFEVVQDSLLSEIKTYTSTTCVNQYGFSYELTEYRKLKAVSKRDGNGSLASEVKTNIEWGQTGALQDVAVGYIYDTDLLSEDGYALYSGDIDGDGYQDIIEFYGNRQGAGTNGYISVKLKNQVLDTVAFIKGNNIFKPSLIIGDIDKDGKDDIYLIKNSNGQYIDMNGTITFDDRIVIDRYKFNGTGFDKTNAASVADNRIPVGVKTDYQAFLGNINGDQYPDLIIVPYWLEARNGSKNGNIITFAGQADGSFGDPSYSNLNYSGNERGDWHRPLIGDFNSDGTPDVLHTLCQDPDDHPALHSYNGVDVQLSRNWGNPLYYVAGCCSDRQMFETLYPIDANNDGRTDVLVHRDNSYEENGVTYKWHILQSNGHNSAPAQFSTPFPNNKPIGSSQNRYYPIILDYNGDGMQDIVIAYENAYNYYTPQLEYNYLTSWLFYKNLNGTFVLDASYVDYKQTRRSKTYPVVMDINNDGVQDIVYAEGTECRAFTMPNAAKRNLVHKITNSLGQVEEFSYKNNSSYEMPANSDIRTLNAPIMLVQQHKQSNGETVSYTFTKAKYHKLKGFIGFEKITANNITQNRKTVSTYEIVDNTKYFNMALKEQITYRTPQDEELTKTVFHNAVKESNIIKFNQLNLNNQFTVISRRIDIVDNITVTDNIQNFSTTTINEFDDFGRKTQEKTIAGGYTDIIDYQFVTDVALPTGNNFIMGVVIVKPFAFLPLSQTVTHTKAAESISSRTDFVYNAKGQITHQTEFADKLKQITSEFQYYSAGNLKKTILTQPDFSAQTTEYFYDYLYRLPTSKKNTLGKFSYKSYDYGTGNILSETGIDGLTTNYVYNSRGQLYQKTLPTGQLIEYSSVLDNANGGNVRTSRNSINMIADYTLTYYDIFGREVYSSQTAINGQRLISENFYNAKGQLIKTIHPHAASDAVKYTEYIYDIYGRPEQKKYFDGINTLITGYEYENLQTTITNPDGTQQTVLKNEKGLVTLRSDFGGDIAYEYNAAGQPVKITASDGSETLFEYDEYGNQTKLIDPNAGEIVYDYYPNGLLHTQTNAKGDITTINYDNALRENVKIIEGANGQTLRYEYAYVASGNGIGQISNVVYKENNVVKHTQTFSYNDKHLLQNKTENYAGTNYYFSYTYDELGRLKTKTSQNSGLTVENFYEIYGGLCEIQANSEVVWAKNSQNAQGHITNFTLGNSIIVNHSYYPNEMLRSITATTFSAVYQNFGYNYDNRYNLTKRTDLVRAKYEDFVYDDLSRLTEAQLNGTTYLQQYYRNNNGNITYKNDVGKYLYGDDRPHAVEALDTTGAVRDNGITDDRQYLEYTPFGKVSSVKQEYNQIETEYYGIFYGANQQRIQTDFYSHTDRKFTRFYFGSFEVEKDSANNSALIDYIYAPTGLCAIRKKFLQTNETALYYVLNDNMGSVQTVTDESGNILNQYYYTPWGGRTRIDENTAIADVTDRGYTGHEHLTSLGLINMNGRIYDPTLARFLSPDPYVQAPDFSQGFNRFSYCLNNPFRYSDPSGESLSVVAVMAIYFAVYALIEYGSQVYYNYQSSDAMVAQGYSPMSNRDKWFGRIDWLDVGINGLAGAITGVVPAAGPWVMYGTPLLTNAFNWYGDGEFQTVFDGSIPLSQYVFNTAVEEVSLYTTNVIKTGLATPSKDIFNPANHTKYFSKEILGKEITMRSIEDMLQQGVASWMDYTIKAPFYPEFNQDRLQTPYVPNNSVFPPSNQYKKINKSNTNDDEQSKRKKEIENLSKYLYLNY
ncbi:MAG: FG-GAP-like repeat-containing protein [Prevotellaceae bacterium]|jgi:RHS repeat-associated protein|nr:FG-GAP-like repeat-containing protein [Prevotellaceae bacterium]